MDFNKYLKDKYFILFLLILVFGIGLRLYYFNVNQAVWWDEASYLNGAKEFGGVTNLGHDIWSVRRPFLLSIFWGGLYALGANELVIRITLLLFSIITLIAVYLLAKEMYNEKIALITTLGLSTLGLHLFLTARLLTEVPAICVTLIAYWLFFRDYVNEKNKSRVWLSFLFIGLAMFTRASMVLALIPMLLIVLLKEGRHIIKNKSVIKAVLLALAVVSPFIIYVMVKLKTINIFYALKELIGIGENRFSNPFAVGFARFLEYLNFIPYEFKWAYFIMIIIGLYIFVDFFIGIDLHYKNKSKHFFREIFMLSWIVIFLFFFSFLVVNPGSYAEPRYILPMFPALLMLSANGFMFLEKLVKKIDFRLAILAILVILAVGTYSQMVYSNQMIVSKKDSFAQIKETGLFLKGKTTNTILINSNQMEFMYYAEVYAEGWANETNFFDSLKTENTDYVIISTLFDNPREQYNIPQEFQQYLTPIYATFYDMDKKQVATVIYQVNHQKVESISTADAMKEIKILPVQ